MTDATPTAASGPLTVVLVHGAFADASNWAGVIPILQAAGVDVLAPPNPLRGINHDAAYIASVASQIPGPVLLVGHSYGGAVITNAGTRAENVRGLVYVGAFIPDEGETLQDLADQATDSKVLPALRPMQYPTGPGSAPTAEFIIDPASFHEVFCADLPAEQAAILAVSQRPLAGVSFGEPTAGSGLEVASHVGDHLPQRLRHRPFRRALHGRTRRRHDHRGRGLARHDDFAAPGRRRRDPDRGRRGLVTLTARTGQPQRSPSES